ncbi:MAG: thiamine phosphate synthase [Bacteroidales bacterium]|jgi:thiamine-phosphate pyrophosphorylase|nr:thiamine phosphate synthase [Bacteroidales bacterium]
MKTLHIISYPDIFDGEAKVLIDLMQHFDVRVHLRKPKVSEEDYISLVKQLPESYYSKLILHAAYHLALTYDFGGLHFSTSKRNLANSVGLNNKKSTSCHSLEELKSLSENYSSCFLSPIFESISNEAYRGDLNLKEVEEYLKSDHTIEVIALGGIHPGNIRAIKDMGFDGAAVLGTVWGNMPSKNDFFRARVKALFEMI